MKQLEALSLRPFQSYCLAPARRQPTWQIAENSSPLAELNVFFKPGEIGLGTGDDGQGDELGCVVAMQPFYFPFKRF